MLKLWKCTFWRLVVQIILSVNRGNGGNDGIDLPLKVGSPPTLVEMVEITSEMTHTFLVETVEMVEMVEIVITTLVWPHPTLVEMVEMV